jgi:NADH-quinone oxidoreductase subunit F
MIEQAINLEAMKRHYEESRSAITRRVIVCAGTGCVANGSLKVFAALENEIAGRGLAVVVELGHDCGGDVLLSKSGCQGFCQAGPLVTVEPEGYLYVHVKPDDVADIVEQTLINNRPVDRLLYSDPTTGRSYAKTHEIPFYRRQRRAVLGDCGNIDPENIGEYIARGGYEAARRAFTRCDPSRSARRSPLPSSRPRRRRLPHRKKWTLTLAEKSDKKYVICKATRATPARSWIAVSWRAIRIA